MKPPAAVPLGPWVRGIQNVNDPAMTPKGAVVEANNVYIYSDGSFAPRPGYDLVTAGGHSLFRHNGKTYGVMSGAIVQFLDNSAVPLFSPVVGRVSWGVLNDCPVFTSNDVLGWIPSDGPARQIGMPAPGGGSATVGDGTEAVTFISADGEEGPAVIGGSRTSTDPRVARVRVYKLRAQGDVFYADAEYIVNTSVPVTPPFGKPCDTLHKARMPGGSYVRYWRGRLLVARGRTLFFSEPLRYGLYDERTGFVTFEARIDFIEPVENGVYVALKNVGVVFLAGETPEKWERRTAAVLPAQPGASALIPTAQMKLDVQGKPEWSAVWLTEKGFALGFPSGNVLYPQADLLSGLPLGTGALHFEGDRLIALSQ